MVKLLIIADDLTGAVDSGVQFAGQGIQTLVTTDADIDISKAEKYVEVLVVSTGTRHLRAERAYEIVFSLTKKAISCGVGNIYKKTDSVLRGNIGSELLAVMDGSGNDKLMFIPAYPDNDRTTYGGIQYVSGVPIALSHFTRDPFNPVTSSYIPDIIGQYAIARTVVVRQGEIPDFDMHHGIFVFDVETNEDMVNIKNMLDRAGQLKLTAGCAGFAGVLCNSLNFSKHKHELPIPGENMLIISGSINEVSMGQMDFLKETGCNGISLTPEQRLNGVSSVSTGCDGPVSFIKTTLKQDGLAYIETVKTDSGIVEANRSSIAENIGQIVRQVLDDCPVGYLFVIGGDTLVGVMDQLGINEIIPAFELLPGVALSIVSSSNYSFNLITKSGGFGQKEALVSVLSLLPSPSSISSLSPIPLLIGYKKIEKTIFED